MGNNRELAEEWFKKAEEDLSLAKDLLNRKEYFSHICFLAQQAGEKYLKGFLIFDSKEFEKVHDLERLIELTRDKGRPFSGIVEGASVLSTFYVQARYPLGETQTGITFDDAQKAVTYADEIKRIVLSKTKKDE
ncbi:MAG: HEPN domain-containing protein [Candidatus Doudnabacteria bacterium]|nr:HEPN domain-containing protein [Candidatus Doudnabacteria bacterium]